jgi:WD40 repeat protein
MSKFRFARGISSKRLAVLAATALLPTFATSADGQETTLVSVDSSGTQGDGDSQAESLSADGQVVAFDSLASSLVAGDANGFVDVFVHDRSTGITERVSVDSSGAEGDFGGHSPSISADGQIVAFMSYATNLIAGDTNGFTDVFVHDRSTGVTERVSVDSSGTEANSDSTCVSISADGMVVAIVSDATNLVSGDTNGFTDVFVHDRATGITERVSVDSSGVQGDGDISFGVSISADGEVVAFSSASTNLVAGDKRGYYDIFVHDRATGITERESVNSSGVQGNSDSFFPSVSGDGQVVAFNSFATNLVSGDTNQDPDIFVHDRATGITERVSVDSSGAQANSYSLVFTPISADGKVIAFSSLASNLVAGDTNGFIDVFFHNRSTGMTERASVDSSGTQGNDRSDPGSLSADGLFLAFDSWASNLVAGDTNGFRDVFVHECCSIPASWNNYGTGFPGTNGIPSLTSQQNPSFGTTTTLLLANSYGAPTVGLLFIGFQRGSFPTKFGGELLVVPAVIDPISFSYGADSFTGTIPDDLDLCGLPVDLQAIEADSGAARGVSFTPGLELVIGH